jgi:hypothetical protein
MNMIEFLLSLRRLPLIILAALLMILAGCLASGEQSTSVPAVVNVSPEATASLADPTSAPATAEPTLTATQLPVNTATPRAKPTLTATQRPVKIATVTPRADLSVAPARGAPAPALMLTDLNGDEVSLSDLQGKTVLLNFWTTW